MIHRAAICTILLLLSSCQTNSTYGEGPISLSYNANNGFQAYLTTAEKGFFAVSTDGKTYGYSFCPESLCTEDAGAVALRSCRNRSKGVPCKVYAAGDRIVWQGVQETGKRSTKVNADIGSGDVTTALSVERKFQEYLELDSPEYFAISTNGYESGYSFCRNPPCLTEGYREVAISSCVQHSASNGSCRIYAIGRKVVWKGRVTFFSQRSQDTVDGGRWQNEKDSVLCRAAVDSRTATEWTTNNSYKGAVSAAISRNYTAEECAKLW